MAVPCFGWPHVHVTLALTQNTYTTNWHNLPTSITQRAFILKCMLVTSYKWWILRQSKTMCVTCSYVNKQYCIETCFKFIWNFSRSNFGESSSCLYLFFCACLLVSKNKIVERELIEIVNNEEKKEHTSMSAFCAIQHKHKINCYSYVW